MDIDLNKFLSLIEKYKDIYIFRHINPDGDALGSQFALFEFIKLNFKNKNVYPVCADDISDIPENLRNEFPKSINTKNKPINNSLIIILDTSSQNRVSGYLVGENNLVIRIDHHLLIEKYFDYQIYNPKAGSTSEILLDLFLNAIKNKKYKISDKLSYYLTIGILSDFKKYPYKLSSQLLINFYNLTKDKINVYDVWSKINSYGIDFVKYQSLVTSKLKSLKDFYYFVDDKNIYKKYKLNINQALDTINNLSKTKEINKILISVYDSKTKIFYTELRSKEKDVFNIVKKYGGGGHSLACGAKIFSKKDLDNLIKDIAKQ